MTGITFTFEIDELAARERISGLIDRMQDPAEFYKAVGERLVNSATANFEREAGPDGTPWPALRPSTLSQRIKNKVASTKILTATQALKASIIYQLESGGVRIGSPLAYAAVQQFGAEQGAFGAFIGRDKNGRDHFHHLPWGDIPARPYLGVSAEDETEIIELAETWLEME
jgi:phage virion morphogenesis protein